MANQIVDDESPARPPDVLNQPHDLFRRQMMRSQRADRGVRFRKLFCYGIGLDHRHARARRWLLIDADYLDAGSLFQILQQRPCAAADVENAMYGTVIGADEALDCRVRAEPFVDEFQIAMKFIKHRASYLRRIHQLRFEGSDHLPRASPSARMRLW